MVQQNFSYFLFMLDSHLHLIPLDCDVPVGQAVPLDSETA